MIDSHCHLFYDSIKNNLKKIIIRAKNNNISCILSINTKMHSFLEHYSLIEKIQSVYISCGVHPDEINDKNIPSTNEIIEYCKLEKVIGIGETGLDFYRSHESKKSQILSFENHIESSYITGIPLIIHQRSSEKEIMEVLKSYNKSQQLNVVFHCFTGSKELLAFCLDNNFYISISGIITFKNASNLRDTIINIPIKSILVESDSPFLAPIPYRGKQNEPAYVYFIGQYLAEYFGYTFEEFEKITNDNFYNLFSKAIRYNDIVI